MSAEPARTSLGVLIGAAVGLLVGVALYFSLGWVHVPAESLAWIAAPAAHVVSWVTGWPMEQEMGIVCYVVGLALTIVSITTLLGTIVGALAAGAPRR